MTARLVAAWRRLTATSLSCLTGRCDQCIELVHRNPFASVTWCHCTRPNCRHPYLLAAREAVSS